MLEGSTTASGVFFLLLLLLLPLLLLLGTRPRALSMKLVLCSRLFPSVRDMCCNLLSSPMMELMSASLNLLLVPHVAALDAVSNLAASCSYFIIAALEV